MHNSHVPPPAILVGGGVNALSIARTLGARGVEVHSIAPTDADVRYSRYCRWIGPNVTGKSIADQADFLTGDKSRGLHGGVLLTTSDDGLELIARHRAELADYYRLDLSNPAAQRKMLNKLSTYEAATEARVATPNYWTVRSCADLQALDATPRFPVVVKPLYTHKFQRQFGQKLFIVHSRVELMEKLRLIETQGETMMLVEMIGGGDDQLCSYYTYLDEDGLPTFHFTKRIIRRHPEVFGNACNHVTDHNEEVKEAALQLFRHVGIRGVANAEFKRDPLDGRLKLIECNARFTAANCLLHRSGVDLAGYVYDRAIGLDPQPPGSYRGGIRLWYPVEDLRCSWRLHRAGRLTSRAWRQTIRRRFVLPRFSWRDPGPSIAHEAARAWKACRLIVDAGMRFIRQASPSSRSVRSRGELTHAR